MIVNKIRFASTRAGRVPKRIERDLDNCVARQLPAILIPRLDLSVGQFELGRQFHSILNAEVFLPLKGRFQGLKLMIGKGRSCFPLFLGMMRLLRIGTATSAAAEVIL